MLDDVVQFDEGIMEKYLNGETITEEEIKKCIRKGVISTELYPVLCGTAFKNKGVKKLLDAIVEFLPSPLDVPPIKGETEDGQIINVIADDNAPLSALAFKVATDPFIGRLTYIRIYAGTLQKGFICY